MQLNFPISCTKSNTFNYQLTFIVKNFSIVQTLFIYVFMYLKLTLIIKTQSL